MCLVQRMEFGNQLVQFLYLLSQLHLLCTNYLSYKHPNLFVYGTDVQKHSYQIDMSDPLQDKWLGHLMNLIRQAL